MAHRFTFTVEVTLERDAGKFMPRDEMAELIMSEIEGADPGSISGGPDGDSEYSVTDWVISEA